MIEEPIRKLTVDQYIVQNCQYCIVDSYNMSKTNDELIKLNPDDWRDKKTLQWLDYARNDNYITCKMHIMRYYMAVEYGVIEEVEMLFITKHQQSMLDECREMAKERIKEWEREKLEKEAKEKSSEELKKEYEIDTDYIAEQKFLIWLMWLVPIACTGWFSVVVWTIVQVVGYTKAIQVKYDKSLPIEERPEIIEMNKLKNLTNYDKWMLAINTDCVKVGEKRYRYVDK